MKKKTIKKAQNNPYVITTLWYPQIFPWIQSFIMKEAGIYCLIYFSLGTSWKETVSGEFKLYICKNLLFYKCLHGHYAHKQIRMFRQPQTWAMVYAKMVLQYFNEWEWL